MSSTSPSGGRIPVRLWIGIVVALSAAFALLSASRYGALVGGRGIVIFSVLALVSLVGAAVAVLSLRHPSDLASTPQTGALLDRVQADPELLRVAEGTASAEELQSTLVAAVDAAEAERLFGVTDPREWSAAVRWDELYDALPRKGSQVRR